MRSILRIGCISLSLLLIVQLLLLQTRLYGVRSPYTTSWLPLFWVAVDLRRMNTALLLVGSEIAPHRRAKK